MNSTTRALYSPLWEKLNNDVFMGEQKLRDLKGVSANAVLFQIPAISPQEFQGSSSCDFSGCPFKALNEDNQNNPLALRFL